ncbi:hypothetical protein HK102_012779, partial [Quaeritorhiza haematococci]
MTPPSSSSLGNARHTTSTSTVDRIDVGEGDVVETLIQHREKVYDFSYDLLRRQQASNKPLPCNSVFATFFSSTHFSSYTTTPTSPPSPTSASLSHSASSLISGESRSDRADRFAIHHILARSLHDTLFNSLGRPSVLQAFVSFLAPRKEIHLSRGACSVSDVEVLRGMRDHLVCNMGDYVGHTTTTTTTSTASRMVRENPVTEYILSTKASIKRGLSAVIPASTWTSPTTTNPTNPTTNSSESESLEARLTALVWDAALTFLVVRSFDPT